MTKGNKEADIMCNLSEGILEYGRRDMLREVILVEIKGQKTNEEIHKKYAHLGATIELIEEVRNEFCSMA